MNQWRKVIMSHGEIISNQQASIYEPVFDWNLPSKIVLKLEQINFSLNFVRLKHLSDNYNNISVIIKYSGLHLKKFQWNFQLKNPSDNEALNIDLPDADLADNVIYILPSGKRLHIHIALYADGKQILESEESILILPPVEILSEIKSTYSTVFLQNQFPLINQLNIINNSPEALEALRVEAKFDPPDFKPVVWNIDNISSNHSINLQEEKLKLSTGSLEKLNEKRLIKLIITVYSSKTIIAQCTKEIELLPKNHWAGELNMPELLAAFVTPNDSYCNIILKKASNLLMKNGQDSKLDGYQSNTRERPYMVAAALWSIISAEGISYCVPPASFARTGQKIRFSSDIAKFKLATCLDTALLFASCLEQAGLNSVIALTNGHAMVGVWLVNDNLPLLTCDDPVDLRNRIALKDLVLFETTMVTNDTPIRFDQAIREADRKISENQEHKFSFAIDIKQARTRKISPIYFTDSKDHDLAEKNVKQEISLPLPPVLPPVTIKDENKCDLTSETRVEQWRRHLLDLSKRNSLLNINKRRLAFEIMCPNLGLLVAELATGKKFSMISKDVLLSSGRSEKQFRKQTGDDLEEKFIIDKLQLRTLVANCGESELEKRLINLFRKAKSNFEEGGSNTLFLSIGALRWKSRTDTDKFYKAPLLLLPVKLERTSARVKPKIIQNPNEKPIFNLTLIELLIQDFEIDLTEFQSSLPQNENRVDIQRIWSTVRSKIKETPGFEVAEDIILSNFSFAKYLMWKDISDRIDDLKKSPFVNHLVENPTDPYPFRTSFLNLNEVDRKINPTEFYAPLNADSSQIVAIEASTTGKDFILEGPPGTGKSETIANIIAHNMAHGKKILFVSEKMAAIDVVYSRLKKVGLGHLCLEFHSNKASKRSVVDQLNEAWQERDTFSSEKWKEHTKDLKTLRDKLNSYVEELHRKSELGFSPFEALSRSVRYSESRRVNLEWEQNLNTAPCKNQNDTKKAIKLAKDLGLSFKESNKLNPKAFALITFSD